MPRQQHNSNRRNTIEHHRTHYFKNNYHLIIFKKYKFYYLPVFISVHEHVHSTFLHVYYMYVHPNITTSFLELTGVAFQNYTLPAPPSRRLKALSYAPSSVKALSYALSNLSCSDGSAGNAAPARTTLPATDGTLLNLLSA